MYEQFYVDMNRKYYALIPINTLIFPKDKKLSQVQLPKINTDPVAFSNSPFIVYIYFFNFFPNVLGWPNTFVVHVFPVTWAHWLFAILKHDIFKW